MIAGHVCNRAGAKYAYVIKHPAVQEHLREPEVIGGGAGHAAVATEQFWRVSHIGLVGQLASRRVCHGLRDAVPAVLGHVIAGVSHVQWPGRVLSDKRSSDIPEITSINRPVTSTPWL